MSKMLRVLSLLLITVLFAGCDVLSQFLEEENKEKSFSEVLVEEFIAEMKGERSRATETTVLSSEKAATVSDYILQTINDKNLANSRSLSELMPVIATASQTSLVTVVDSEEERISLVQTISKSSVSVITSNKSTSAEANQITDIISSVTAAQIENISNSGISSTNISTTVQLTLAITVSCLGKVTTNSIAITQAITKITAAASNSVAKNSQVTADIISDTIASLPTTAVTASTTIDNVAVDESEILRSAYSAASESAKKLSEDETLELDLTSTLTKILETTTTKISNSQELDISISEVSVRLLKETIKNVADNETALADLTSKLQNSEAVKNCMNVDTSTIKALSSGSDDVGFTENFDLTEAESLPDDWEITYGDYNTSVYVVDSSVFTPASGVNCLMFIDNSEEKSPVIQKNISYLNDGDLRYGQVKLKIFCPTATNNAPTLKMNIKDSDGNTIIDYKVVDGFKIKTKDHVIGAHITDEWFEFIIKWDMVSGYNQCVYNGEALPSRPLRSSECPNYITFQAGDYDRSGTLIYIDSIEFSTDAETISHGISDTGYTEDFDSTEESSLPKDEWISTKDSDNMSVYVTTPSEIRADSGNKCLMFIDNNEETYPNISKDFSYYNNEDLTYGQLKFKIYTPGGDNNSRFYIKLKDEENNSLTQYYFDSTLFVRNTTSRDYTGSYPTNEWFEFVIKWDENSGFIQSILNNEIIETSKMAQDTMPAFFEIQGGSTAEVGTKFYIDSCEFSTNEESIEAIEYGAGFIEDFDSSAVGFLPGSFTLYRGGSDTSAVVVDSSTVTPDSGSNCLMLSDNSDIYYPEIQKQIYYYNDEDLNYGQLKVKIYCPSEDSNYPYLRLMVKDYENRYVARYKFNSSNILNEETGHIVGSYESDVWFEFTIKWDRDNKTYQSLYNGERLETTALAAIKMPAELFIRNGYNSRTGSTVYIDSIELTTEEETIIAPGDDFDSYSSGTDIGEFDSWTSTYTNGDTIIAQISSEKSASGSNALFLYDNDAESTPFAYKEFANGTSKSGSICFRALFPDSNEHSSYISLGQGIYTPSYYFRLSIRASGLIEWDLTEGDDPNLANISLNEWHDFEIYWNSSGLVSLFVDGDLLADEMIQSETGYSSTNIPSSILFSAGTSDGLETKLYIDDIYSGLFE